LGQPLNNLLHNLPKSNLQMHAVKFPVFPFSKFLDSLPRLGPEMRSIGEVMGIADASGAAFAKGFSAVGFEFKTRGHVVIVTDRKLSEQTRELLDVLHTESSLLPTLIHTREELLQSGTPYEQFQVDSAEALVECFGDLKKDGLACVVALCGAEHNKFKKSLCELHKNALASKVPFILTESLFETWGKAALAVQSLKSVRPL